MGEIDRLTHLGVALGDRLSGLGRHHLDQVVPVRGECPSGPVQDGGTLESAERAPFLASAGDRRDDPIQLIAARDAGRRDRLRAQDGRRHTVEDPATPRAIGRKRRVGVRRVAERPECVPSVEIVRRDPAAAQPQNHIGQASIDSVDPLSVAGNGSELLSCRGGLGQ